MHVCMHVCICIYAHNYTHKDIHTQTHTNLQINTQAYLNCTHVKNFICLCTYLHTQRYTHTDTHKLTNKHTGIPHLHTRQKFPPSMHIITHTKIHTHTTTHSSQTKTQAYLNGTHVKNFLRLRAILVKIFGTIFSVSSGLACGQEGPMIHIGAGIASGMTRGEKLYRKLLCWKLDTPRKMDHNVFNLFRNDR
jgi:hypothetical protein